MLPNQLTTDPRLRASYNPLTLSKEYKTIAKFYLPQPNTKIGKSFFKVLSARYSNRRFNQLTDEQLASFLWYSSKTLTLDQGANNIFCQHRFVPSAGGIHPVDLILVDPLEGSVSIYDPIAHALCKLDVSDAEVATFLRYTNEVLDIQAGIMVWFAARPEKVSAKYENELSLIWRDVGALIASMYLIAEALSLNCCALGVLGDKELKALTRNPSIMGAGGCIIGARPKTGIKKKNSTTNS